MTITDILDIIKELKANADAGKRLTAAQQFIGLRGPKIGFF
jgi:pyruvate ferredoxin oxidoreductase alpha subunit